MKNKHSLTPNKFMSTAVLVVNFMLFFLVTTFFGCKKDQPVNKPELPLYQQIGAAPKKYSTLNVSPETQVKANSADFISRWNSAKAGMLNLGGRKLQSFVFKFITDTELSISFTYLLPGGQQAEALFKYTYVVDDAGNTTLTYNSADSNAESIAAALTTIKEDYFDKYKFKIDWIADKLPGSYEILAAYYRTDDPSSYFYGVIGVRSVGVNIFEDSPLYKQIGFEKKFTGINIIPETSTEKISSDFRSRWESAKENLLLIGGRQLKSYAIKFISATQLTITFSYSPSTGGTALGTFTCNYTIGPEGYLSNISIASRNTNAVTIEPGLKSILTDYLLVYKFRIEWFDDKIPGSRGSIAAYYRSDDPTSYFYGELTYTRLYEDMGFGKKYSSLTVTPEVSVDFISPDFLSRWNAAKAGVLANGNRQLKSFVLKFISSTQLTITYNYLTSTGAASTGVYTYSYVIDSKGLLKLTYVSRNANATALAPGLPSITDEYLHVYDFRLDWLAGSQTLAAYYRADAPASYFYGTIGN